MKRDKEKNFLFEIRDEREALKSNFQFLKHTLQTIFEVSWRLLCLDNFKK